MRLYGEMQAAGLQADAYTLTALLTACERVGKWQRALQLMGQLQAGGVAPNIHHHNCLLSAFGRAGQWEQVRQVTCAHDLKTCDTAVAASDSCRCCGICQSCTVCV